ncbi:MAG: (2Fe-2S)-binding protein [Chloroflexi bacterium]|nr:(2Fe-2S)-binding protein [Chloroflexota bacterium]
MPRLTVDGRTADVTEDQRLVLAIESQGIAIGHRCGGFARCTTCRVEFQAGEPDTMTKAEYAILSTRELLGQVRLSCQIVCDHDMSVKPIMTKDNQPAWDSTGAEPEKTVTPEAVWYPKSEVAQQASS